MGKHNIKAEIVSQKKLSADIFDMTLNVEIGRAHV